MSIPLRPVFSQPMIWACLAVLTAGCSSTSPAPSATETVSSQPSSPDPGADDWTLVALGDSFTKTQNSHGKTLMDLFAADLADATGHQVTVTDLSDDAGTSDGLADRLTHDGATRDAVANAEIILVSVGGNDSDPFGVYPNGTCSSDQSTAKCLHTYAPRFAGNYQAILDAITTLRDGRPTALRVASADNPFVGWSEAPDRDFGVRFYRQVAEAETSVACRAAEAHDGVCVDYLHIFGGSDGTRDPKPYLAADHAHPGDRGIRAIADLLLQIGVPELDR